MSVSRRLPAVTAPRSLEELALYFPPSDFWGDSRQHISKTFGDLVLKAGIVVLPSGDNTITFDEPFTTQVFFGAFYIMNDHQDHLNTSSFGLTSISTHNTKAATITAYFLTLGI